MKSKSNKIIEIPAAFLERMAGLLKEDYPHFLASLELPALQGLRINTLKCSVAEFLGRSPWKLHPTPWCSSGFILDSSIDTAQSPPGKHPYHAAGLYYLQEPSAMAVAEALAPQPGERVLDLAAAPGGKATHLAALMQNAGLLVANEIHPRRALDLAENLERCGVTQAIVTRETPQRLADQLGEYFDRVLLDAPCSGEGMFRKGMIARQEWMIGLAKSCARRQTGILEQAARMLKVGGNLVYSTCTFFPLENEGVIAEFLSHHPEFDLRDSQQLPGFDHGRPEWIGLPEDDRISRTIRIWPHRAQGEGHFIALLVKNGFTGHPQAARVLHKKRIGLLRPNRAALAIFSPFADEFLHMPIDSSRLIQTGSYLYLLPEHPPDLDNVKLIRPGWWLGSIQKGRFIPSHALAMGIKPEQASCSLSLSPDDPSIRGYLTGESVAYPGEEGWILLTVEGFPLGWGKKVHEVIKNYYPHGLRRYG